MILRIRLTTTVATIFDFGKNVQIVGISITSSVTANITITFDNQQNLSANVFSQSIISRITNAQFQQINDLQILTTQIAAQSSAAGIVDIIVSYRD